MKAIVEMPKGTKYKYEVNKTTALLSLDRVILSSVPFNYGFLASTLSEDGDPLDCFILSEEPIPPLTEVGIELIGYIDCLDNGVSDEKLVAKIEGDAFYDYLAFTKILDYLKTYKDGMVIKNWHINKQEASDLVIKAKERYESK